MIAIVAFAIFQQCFTGPNVLTPESSCCRCGYQIARSGESITVGPFDYDGDGDIDLHDYGQFQREYK